MKNIIHITDNNKHKIMADSGFIQGSTNESSRERMKKILSMAVLNELTERQRICIIDYYSTEKSKRRLPKILGLIRQRFHAILLRQGTS